MHTQLSPGSIRDKRRRFLSKGQSRKESSRTYPAQFPFVQPRSNCSCGGSCPACRPGLPVQTKLNISQPNDRYEREADQVASRVVESGGQAVEISKMDQAPDLYRLSTRASPSEDDTMLVPAGAMGVPDEDIPVQRKATDEQQEDDENPPIQRLKIVGPAKGSSAEKQQAFERRLAATRNQGQPLKPRQRRYMESRFRRDFSQVRIHDGSQAQQLSSDIHARAFTHGGDIYFNRGEYRPETPMGMNVLAHELTHVVQQGAAPKRGSTASDGVTPRIGGNGSASKFGNKVARMPSIGSGDTPSRTGVRPWNTPHPIGNDYRLQTDAGSLVNGWVAYSPYQNQWRYWCHGYSLGTYRNNVWGYSVYSGPSMRTVIRDEWRRIPSSKARSGDLAVWTAYQHSAVFSSIAKTSAGSLDENTSRLNSKNGQAPLDSYSLTQLKAEPEYGPHYRVYRRK